VALLLVRDAGGLRDAAREVLVAGLGALFTLLHQLDGEGEAQHTGQQDVPAHSAEVGLCIMPDVLLPETIVALLVAGDVLQNLTVGGVLGHRRQPRVDVVLGDLGAQGVQDGPMPGIERLTLCGHMGCPPPARGSATLYVAPRHPLMAGTVPDGAQHVKGLKGTGGVPLRIRRTDAGRWRTALAPRGNPALGAAAIVASGRARHGRLLVLRPAESDPRQARSARQLIRDGTRPLA